MRIQIRYPPKKLVKVGTYGYKKIKVFASSKMLGYNPYFYIKKEGDWYRLEQKDMDKLDY